MFGALLLGLWLASTPQEGLISVCAVNDGQPLPGTTIEVTPAAFGKSTIGTTAVNGCVQFVVRRNAGLQVRARLEGFAESVTAVFVPAASGEELEVILELPVGSTIYGCGLSMIDFTESGAVTRISAVELQFLPLP